MNASEAMQTEICQQKRDRRSVTKQIHDEYKHGYAGVWFEQNELAVVVKGTNLAEIYHASNASLQISKDSLGRNDKSLRTGNIYCQRYKRTKQQE